MDFSGKCNTSSRGPAALALALAALLGAAGGCGSTTDPDPGPDLEPTFSNVQSAIFTPHCATSGCHDSATRQEGQDLSAGNAYASTVGVPSRQDPSRQRIEPGFPERSYLVAKVRGGPDIRESRMPQGRPPLSEDRIQLLEQWIDRGAPQD